jgi:hypothetical protein
VVLRFRRRSGDHGFDRTSAEIFIIRKQVPVRIHGLGDRGMGAVLDPLEPSPISTRGPPSPP